ncbi:MAG: dCTP deaminase [Candidatus Marsarchaeota archaeon]|jgi:dCTP deaminase|nr:dCTP deaminase [Candidatus Marsarchaeota archaeon]
MILGDRDLKYYLEKRRIVVEPITNETIHENGMDFRIGNEIVRFNETDKIFESGDKNNFDEFFKIEKGDSFIIQPHEHLLLTTKEYIKLPDDMIVFVNLKSSLARMGIFIPPTVIDAGFEGNVTIEVLGSKFPVRLKENMRFIHLIFARTLSPVEYPYKGKYQSQKGVTMTKTDNMF